MLHEQDEAESPDAEGWHVRFLVFETLEEARARILGLGAAIEVLSPRALRCTVADYAAQAAALYTGDRESRVAPVSSGGE